MDPGRGRERPDLTESASPRARGGFSLVSPLLWHLFTLAAGAVVLMYAARGQWFFGDEWDFLTDRSVTIGRDGLLEPHNEHWSTVPIVLYGMTFRLLGVGSYAPYVALVLVAHLVVVHLGWRVMLRGGVNPWIATALCVALIPFGPGADNLLWAFQIGFVGSVALGLAAILWVDRDDLSLRREGAGWGLSILGLMFSGISVPLVGATAAVSWMRRGFKSFAITASVPMAVFLLWFLTLGRSGLSADGPTRDSLRVFHEFLGRGAGAVLTLGTPTVLAGVIPLVLAAVAMILRRRRGVALPSAPLGAAFGWLLLLLMVSVVRAPLGLDAAEATRYVYIGGALLLPLLAVGVSDLLGQRALGIVLVALLAVPWAAHNTVLLLREADLQAHRESVIRQQIVAGGTVFDGEPVLRVQPDVVFSPDLSLDELEILLPELAEGIEPSPEAVVRASISLQISATSTATYGSAAAPTLAARAEGAKLVRNADGCFDVRPTSSDARVLVPLGPPFSLAVSSPVSTAIDVGIAAGGIRPDYFLATQVGEGETVFLNAVIDERLVGDGDLMLRLTTPLTLCSP